MIQTKGLTWVLSCLCTVYHIPVSIKKIYILFWKERVSNKSYHLLYIYTYMVNPLYHSFKFVWQIQQPLVVLLCFFYSNNINDKDNNCSQLSTYKKNWNEKEKSQTTVKRIAETTTTKVGTMKLNTQYKTSRKRSRPIS